MMIRIPFTSIIINAHEKAGFFAPVIKIFSDKKNRVFNIYFHGKEHCPLLIGSDGPIRPLPSRRFAHRPGTEREFYKFLYKKTA
ncbi:Uncharacterized protein dnm_024120 [Desulfonema magnum]|uniref:Uncharacterized protein n=1 Tax=Desulfonema magnum TaxID=45655 RepID=A0A975BJD1_9BACT|nr:Uncharacterized protein dnm_024120 [Desulfonema magnum]